ncbi:hypothetical protein MTO96_042377 [Rhipicephalus appendiculatus]
MDTSVQLAGEQNDACDAVAIMERTPAAPARLSACTAVGRIQPTPQNASCGKESGAWPPSMRPLPPTCLIARLKQPCGQALGGRGGPHLNQAPGKSYAAVVGAPSTVVVNSTHPRQPVYVRRELPHAHIDATDVTGGALECCAVTVRLNGVDTAVATVYVRPGQRWNATELLHLTSRLGSDFPLCGDMNAHHTMWGSRTCSSRGSELVDVIHQLGLQVLNTGSFTFVRRTGRPSCSAIDVSLASEGARTRQCTTIDWRAFRQRLRESPVDQDFLGLATAAAQAATIQCGVPENHPVPDLRHLNLRAARRKAERRYLKAQSSGHRTLFNHVDTVCRRHANHRIRQSWQGICQSLSWARGGSRAWRLLRSLVIGPMAWQAVLSVAIRFGISEQELAERLADRFTVLPVAQPVAIMTAPTPKPPQGYHPTWTASQISALG